MDKNNSGKLPTWASQAIGTGGLLLLPAGLALTIYAPPVATTFGALVPALAAAVGAAPVAVGTGMATQAIVGMGLGLTRGILSVTGLYTGIQGTNNIGTSSQNPFEGQIDFKSVYEEATLEEQQTLKNEFYALGMLFDSMANILNMTNNIYFQHDKDYYDPTNPENGEQVKADMHRLFTFANNLVSITDDDPDFNLPFVPLVDYLGQFSVGDNHVLVSYDRNNVNLSVKFRSNLFEDDEYPEEVVWEFSALECALAMKATIFNQSLQQAEVKIINLPYFDTESGEIPDTLVCQNFVRTTDLDRAVYTMAYVDVPSAEDESTTRFFVGLGYDDTLVEPYLYTSEQIIGYTFEDIVEQFHIPIDRLICLNTECEYGEGCENEDGCWNPYIYPEKDLYGYESPINLGMQALFS
ncbi:TPA: hypothetical protein ACGW68_005363 [Bacillus cereus]